MGNRRQEGDRGLSLLPCSCIIWQEACLLSCPRAHLVMTVRHGRHWVVPLASAPTGSYKQ